MLSSTDIHIDEKKMETYLVAYLDFLGSSNRIKEDDEKLLRDIARLYEKTLGFLNLEDTTFSKLQVKIFSDNIIIAQKIDENVPICDYYNVQLSGILVFSAVFQSLALESPGLLLRGGITIGGLHFNDKFVWGPALLRGYELENEFAIYPRIIIDTPVLEIILRLLDDYQTRDPYNKLQPKKELTDASISNNFSYNIVAELKHLVTRDFDGTWYLNYLQFGMLIKERYNVFVDLVGEERVDEAFPGLSNLINILPDLFEGERKCLMKFIKADMPFNVYQKLIWTINYFNSVCATCGFSKYIIQESEYPMTPYYQSYKGGELI